MHTCAPRVAIFLLVSVVVTSAARGQTCSTTGPWQGMFSDSKGSGEISASFTESAGNFSGTVTVTNSNGSKTVAVTGTNTSTVATFGPVILGKSTDWAVGAFSSDCSTMSGSFHLDKPSGPVDGSFSAETAQVKITGVDLVKNTLDVTLTGPAAFTGTLELIAQGQFNGDQTVSVDNGNAESPGQITKSFARTSLRADHFDQLTAQWNVKGFAVKSGPYNLG